MTKLQVMKIYALLISVLFLLTGQAKAQTAEQLEQAYKEQSTEKLKAFFNDWAKDLKPATVRQRKKMSKLVQRAYAIFEAFYNPHDLANHGSTQWGNDIYTGFNYLLIQNAFKIFQKDKVYYTDEEARAYTIDNILKNVPVKYHDKWLASVKSGDKYFVRSYGPNNKLIWDDSEKVLLDSVTNFRPNIVQTTATPLYLTEKYSKLLDGFLGNTHSPFAEGGIMNTARAKGESANRQQFLQNYIKIYYGHWGGSWEYLSSPSIGALVFDKDMKYAKIFYGMIYEGGEAFLKFEDNTWKLISMERKWRQ